MAVRIANPTQATKAATKEILLEQIGKTDAVQTSTTFEIALPDGGSDPAPDPLPDE